MLAEALHPLKSSYDFLLIDCPPALDLPTINALAAANQVIVPIDAGPFTMTGVYNVLTMIQRLKRLKVSLPKPLIVSCRSKETTGRDAVISQLWDTRSVQVAGTMIRAACSDGLRADLRADHQSRLREIARSGGLPGADEGGV